MPDFTSGKQEDVSQGDSQEEAFAEKERERAIEDASGFTDDYVAPEPEEYIEPESETVVEEVAQQMNVNLPQVALPLPMKIIAAVTFIGGLGILGTSLTSVFDADGGTFRTYLLDLASGILFALIAYGLYRQQNWSTWLYGAMVLVGFFINPAFSILPAIIVIYLFMNRRFLYASIFDTLFHKLAGSVGKNLKQ